MASRGRLLALRQDQRRSPRRLPSIAASPRGTAGLQHQRSEASLLYDMAKEQQECDQQSALKLVGPLGLSPRLKPDRAVGLPAGREPERQSKRRIEELLRHVEGSAAALPDDRALFAMENATPLVALPVLHDFRDVLKVIDARERTLQNIKTFLASMMYIRGNARSLPLNVLRRGRAKLARLLARLRVHSTSVVELIQLWRHRYGALPLGRPDGADDDGEEGGGSGGGEAEAGELSGEGEVVSEQKAPSLTMRSAIAAAEETVRPPKPREKRKRAVQLLEPFLWMGCNYLLKMHSDRT